MSSLLMSFRVPHCTFRRPFFAPRSPPICLSQSRRISSGDQCDDEYYFKYTSGRWLNGAAEPQNFAARYRRFNTSALKQAAALAGGASTVVDMKKLAEGNYNKIFLLALDNGKEVIARIPTPHAGPSHLVTASEVATMDYARSRLGLPVPRVLGSSSDSNTPVEAEYIIMEKAEGVELGRVWDGLSSHQKDNVVSEWVKMERRLMAPISGGYGSVYYRRDVAPTSSCDMYTWGVRESAFVIGPSVMPGFWNDEKLHMRLDRGPWQDALSYILAIANRERSWIKHHATPLPDPTVFDPPPEAQQADAHISLLDRYTDVAPSLIPSNPALVRPTLWHRDVHCGNIFLSKDALAEGRIAISAIIDWQHMSIIPLYLQARVPYFIRYYQSALLPLGLQPVSLPDDFETLGEEEKRAAVVENELANRHKLYEASSASQNPDYYEALSFDTRLLIVPPILYSQSTWSGGFIPPRGVLLRLFDHWDRIAKDGETCPIQFDDAEREQHTIEAQDWQNLEDLKEEFQARIGVTEDGWVSADAYDAALVENEAYKKELADDLDPEDREEFISMWPYKPYSDLEVEPPRVDYSLPQIRSFRALSLEVESAEL
ncbi:hypothetical protein BOTBODRAFT_146160 [Botryobasidium botryosum FD-172 SS1]|uniref:Altered inheritance of mitochondria protein 9, mitochondrial n=1 Tax=Botryobasidium botryosum (strain FD-172 SS1) TaxID=930990 RepID=A0A067MPN5_BOTB1|nr:hypothetical protein BOTBODRAFT_146160 [Botryobasidium botryosum FD-172 SS1]